MRPFTHFLGRGYICGPAVTFACAPSDNLAIHVALSRAGEGDVLVGHGGATTTAGLFGELMATDALNRKLGGLLVEGTVRDLADLDRLGFPVLCTGAAPPQCAKRQVISVEAPVVVGGVLVEPGDQIVADRDGALVVGSRFWPEVRREALALAQREDTYLARMRSGERLWDILDLQVSRGASPPDR